MLISDSPKLLAKHALEECSERRHRRFRWLGESVYLVKFPDCALRQSGLLKRSAEFFNKKLVRINKTIS